MKVLRKFSFSDISFIKYVLVGGTAFLLEFISFTVLTTLLISHHSLIYAQSISFMLGLMVSFLGSRYLTFKVKGKNFERSAKSQIALYISIAIFNLLLTNTSMLILTASGFSAVASKLFVMILVVVWNYFIFNKIIFKKDNRIDPDVQNHTSV